MKGKKNKRESASSTVKELHDRIGLIEEFIFSNAFMGKTAAQGPGIRVTAKCGSSMQKGELVYLFYIMMEEGLWFFDSLDDKTNRILFQSFIENNFTYSGEGNVQHAIANSSRHFSECKGFTYREKQLRYLEKIIALLQSRKERLRAQ